MAESINVKFYLDPACPWCWRTSLWIREVAKVRPIAIEWDFFSLSMVNKQADNLAGLNSPSEPALRTLALARRTGGNQAVGDLYLAIGKARHEREAKLDDLEMIRAALQEAKLDEKLLDEALNDPSTIEEINRSHNYIVGQKAIGVPTMVLSQNGKETMPIFGPVITDVPQGEEAGEMWDHVAWLTQRTDFFELKRNR